MAILKFRYIVQAITLASSILVTVPAEADKLWTMFEDEPLSVEDQKRIRDLVGESLAASVKNDWEAARAALLKAWEMKPLPMIAANLGYVELKMGRYREAAEHLKFFLDNAPEGHPERRADAEQQMAECRKHIAIIELKSNIDDARVAMDESALGVTPLATALFVDPGAHTFRITRFGYHSEIRTVSVDPGGNLVIQVNLVAEPPMPRNAAPVFQTTSTEPTSGERSGIQPKTWALIGGAGVTAISLGIGIAYRIRVSSLSSDADSTLAQISALPDTTAEQRANHSECLNRTGTAQQLCEQLWSTRDSQNNATNISNAAFLTAGVFGVATVATYFLWPDMKAAKPRSASRFGVAPLSINRAHGLEIHTAF